MSIFDVGGDRLIICAADGRDGVPVV